MNAVPKVMAHPQFVDTNKLGGPRFLITVDTEEEFDWDAPFSRSAHGTEHVVAISRFQQMCESHRVKPAYLIDYPVANDPRAIELLGGYAHDGRADIGVQLHPWVNPPFDEIVNRDNSYACNLEPALERQKLSVLHETITENFRIKPDIYRAGRYGAGDATADILRELGICIDTSVRSHFDYSSQGGPDYFDYPLSPYWIQRSELMELPITTVFRGILRKMGVSVFRDMLSSKTSRSIMARTGMLERIALTPEGIPLTKAIEGIDCALQDGVPILNFSFHSPSLQPGHTNYVRNEADLEIFYQWWNGIFAHLDKNGVAPISVREIKEAFFG
ncbi:polysaccharide deacetylase family protein [Sphingorhabdus arenilitoris]|uniref:Polysaccharide deacetylase family protein n=1 Tax=Sphingorhabdus arenilitoris TaxID=1490041 RepID=A0ABV8RF87_9SPHN